MIQLYSIASYYAALLSNVMHTLTKSDKKEDRIIRRAQGEICGFHFRLDRTSPRVFQE